MTISELRTLRYKQQAAVLTNRESVWESAARPALFMRSLTFVETTEQLVKISAVAASHDGLLETSVLK